MEPELDCTKLETPFGSLEGEANAPDLGKTGIPGRLLPESILDLQAPLTMQDLASAGRLFMELAYPDGPTTIPEKKRPYFEMPSAASIADYLPPAAFAAGICQGLSKTKAGVPGYEFRLGSSLHAHLKLRVQRMPYQQREVWVYSVDTHDRVVAQAARHLNSTDQAHWRELVEKNGLLKKEIEDALALAGHLTPRSLLRLDLTAPTKA